MCTDMPAVKILFSIWCKYQLVLTTKTATKSNMSPKATLMPNSSPSFQKLSFYLVYIYFPPTWIPSIYLLLASIGTISEEESLQR